MEDDDFDVYISADTAVVVFEKPDTSIIILPVRMHESQVTNIIMRERLMIKIENIDDLMRHLDETPFMGSWGY